ncbi:metal ABC transporter substrate-binding protein [Terrihabitans soli]|uniref:Metal ABC transporter substrate-binding protein n=1 Tax=Terrihabitans soli TaxID=708113 RepID=A0A6S6QFB2_9HYPH|nr:metal ABC transporter substrate-binding protein [Terrihabitans soli]BCJ89763.1 metal ABC transporter substrate-binding protein [Terrihabitans soli]
MVSRRLFLSSLAALGVVFSSGANAQEKVPVVASFSILGDFVQNIGGERVAVTTLVGADGDAHVYAPKPSDAKAVAEAKLVFINGIGFEGWMERLVESSGSKAEIVTASNGIATIAFGGEAEHDDHGGGHTHEHGEKEAHDDHDHGELDPHAWQSVANAMAYVGNIRDALIKADPAGKADYEANAASYLAKLDALDAEVRTTIAALPADGRTIITSHDAFGYFAKAYGIEVVAPQGVSTEAEPTAKQVASLIRQIRAEKVRAIFVENITDPRMIKRIAEESGAKIGGALYSDALSQKDGPAGTYIDMVRHNIRTLSAGLSS